jgi:4-hydroxybenzoate polyprenyltransferase
MLAWLKLLRITNLPTAWSNVLLAFLLVHGSWSPVTELLVLLLASSSFYLGGMVLNDVYDVDRDLVERPERPLPAGEIKVQTAKFVGLGMLVTGVLLALLAGWIAAAGASQLPVWQDPRIRCGIIGVALAVCVWLYDGKLKDTPVAPLLMGGCRFLNVCLGAGTFVSVGSNADGFLGLPVAVFWGAAAIGVLICGTTLLGRNEANENQSRGWLAVACTVIVVGLVGIASLAYCRQGIEVTPMLGKRFPLLIGLISIPIIRSVVTAVVIAKPRAIQSGVISVLRSLIILDASVCYLAAPGQAFYALAVLALMGLVLLLGRFVPST